MKNFLKKSPFMEKNYCIATQGPLKNTIIAFWKMVWFEEIHLIVMLCLLNENSIVSIFF